MSILPEVGYVTEMATLFENELPVAVMVKVQSKTMTLLFQDKLETKFTPGSTVNVTWGQYMPVVEPVDNVYAQTPPFPLKDEVFEPGTPEHDAIMAGWDDKDDKPFGMTASVPIPKA